MITGIIVALPDEISSLTQQKVTKGKCTLINRNIIVTISGAGPLNAAIASQLLIDNGANKLISWGCAAALDKELAPGDLVITKDLITESNLKLSIKSPWFDFVIDKLSALMPNTGCLLESSIIVANSKDKQSLFIHSGAVALDMESIAIAQTAIQHNLPVLVIRCVADPVTMNLPKAVTHAMDQQGDIKITKLLTYLFTHPNEIPGLIKLGLHFSTAKNKLKLVSKHLDIIAGFEQNKANI